MRALTIKGLTAASALALMVIGAAVAVALLWASTLLQEATATAIRDTRSRATASELEVALLTYQRLSNLYVLTDEPDLGSALTQLVSDMNRLRNEAGLTIGSEREQELLDNVSRQLTLYLEQRAQAETANLNIEETIRRGRPALDSLLVNLEALRDLNDLQVLEAHAQALRVNGVSNGIAGTALALLALILSVIVLGMNRFVRRPMLDLHGTITRFRSGDFNARSREKGPREIRELGEAFNNMADALSRQRKDQLASLAGVAHDLRNPLHALRMSIDTLVHAHSYEDSRQAHEMVKRQVDRLTRMTGDLLDAVRIESGHLELIPERIDLREVVEDIVRLYAPTAPGHSITAELPQQPVAVDADPLRMEQAISNLLSNAIKYSPRGGRINVSVNSDNGFAVLNVTDQGIGIARGDLQDLFKAFRRRSTDVAPGAGLGLSVVRWIVEAHAGQVQVDSAPGAGTTFRIVLPEAASGTESTTREAARGAR